MMDNSGSNAPPPCSQAPPANPQQGCPATGHPQQPIASFPPQQPGGYLPQQPVCSPEPYPPQQPGASPPARASPPQQSVICPSGGSTP